MKHYELWATYIDESGDDVYFFKHYEGTLRSCKVCLNKVKEAMEKGDLATYDLVIVQKILYVKV